MLYSRLKEGPQLLKAPGSAGTDEAAYPHEIRQLFKCVAADVFRDAAVIPAKAFGAYNALGKPLHGQWL